MKGCPSGKTGHRDVHLATVAAREFARALNREHRYAEDMYAYRCPDCRRWHLTRKDNWYGEPHAVVFRAPPRALQDWAMGSPE